MEDLNEKLNRLLSSPEGMAKIRSTLASLSQDSDKTGSLNGLLSSLSAPAAASTPAAAAAAPAPSGSGEEIPDLAALAKLAPLLSSMGKDNEDTRLLMALRPYLHGEREERLEDALRLLRMARLLPLLQEQGILGNSHTGGDSHGR